MAKFIIPQGKAYTFQVKVYEEDSYLPQDMTNGAATFRLIAKDDVATPYGVDINAVVVDAINGIIEFSLDAVYTDGLVIERGPKVDGYYLKPTYQGIIDITFTDANPDRVALIDKVYVSPTGA